MASNERSLGWNTTTVNDGASTYDTARMIAMETKTLGNGILITGANLAISGASSTLTIADGAALINGYFYESTTASTIITSTLNGTYTLALIANASGGSFTVTFSTAGTTTVLTSTVRMALCTSGQLTTIGAANYIAFGTVVVGATGLITSVTSFYPYAVGRQNPATQYVTLGGGTAALTTAATYVDLTAYATGNSTSTDGTMSGTAATGAITIRTSGVYTFSFWMHYDTNTTGTRSAQIRNLNAYFMTLTASQLVNNGISVYQAEYTMYIPVTAGTPVVYYLQGWASNATRNVTDSTITVVRV
jgi:hypothetical protein